MNLKPLDLPFRFEAEDVHGVKADRIHDAQPLDLRPDHIHVFSFGLDAVDESAFEILDADEQVRANRFLHSRVRRRFIASHSRTRMILGHLVGCAPQSIQYQVDTLGKPRLVGPSVNPSLIASLNPSVNPSVNPSLNPSLNLQFSLSHSGARGMVAVALGFEVGIDIEHHQTRDLLGLARRFFHPLETSSIEDLSGESQAKAFFQCWTRKEAFVKGLGMGLHFPLSSFQVDTLTVGRSAGKSENQLLLRSDSIPDATTNWRLIDLPITRDESGTAYSAALAANRYSFDLSRWILVED